MGNKVCKMLASILLIGLFVFFSATLKVISMPGNIKVSANTDEASQIASCNLRSNFIYKLDTLDKNEKIISEPKHLDISVKLFGVIPVKKVTLNLVPQIKVVPGGQPIGVKLYTEGPLVVGFSDIDTSSGRKQSPAAIAGLELGDSIIEINGVKIQTNGNISEIINKSGNKVLNVKVNRKGIIKDYEIQPCNTKNKSEYKIGLWVRDSTAGIGTLTFYEPSSGKFGALGHPINDIDTGSMLSVRDGRIYNAKIISIEQGMRGKPGELRGIFSDEDELGNLNKNTASGVYGKMNGENGNGFYQNALPVARQSEIKEGPATILTSLDGSTIKEYDIYIEKLTQQTKPNSKSMIIRITDKELLEKTGGIVQGMSGSPILQDGKLIGAVTHVFVNKPDMGYGIYIEWMLKELGIDL